MAASTSACTTSSPWLRRMPNGGLRASKASRSVLHGGVGVLATIDELSQQREQALGARAPGVCFSEDSCRGMLEPSMSGSASGVRSPASTRWPLTPTTPRRAPVAVDVESSDDDDGFGFRAVPVEQVVIVGARDCADPTSPMSSRSRQTTASDDVQIVRAHRIQTARARSHSIHDIKKGIPLSPPPEPSACPLPPWAPLKPTRVAPAPLQPAPDSPLSSGPSTASPGTPKSAPQRLPASPPSPARSSRRRPGPSAISKDLGSLLERVNEDDSESHSSHASSHISLGFRTHRSVSLPSLARRSDSTPVSLPPPPRPRNKALIRPGSSSSSPTCTTPVPHNSNVTGIQSSELSTPPPMIVVAPRPSFTELSPPPPRRQLATREPPTLNIPPPPPRRDSLDVPSRRSSLHSIPLTPAGIPLPPSAATPAFPSSPHSTVFYSTGSNLDSPLQSTFLPSCKATSVDSGTIRDLYSPRPSDCIDRAYRASTLSNISNPFGDYSFLQPHLNHRASGMSFASDISGYSARSATEAESIPIGLHIRPRPSHEREPHPVSPRSSLLRDVGFGSTFEVDVLLPEADEDEEDDESITEEESKKSSVFTRERAKSLTLPHISIASLNKVDRVLGKGAARALISGVHVHVPHLSISSMSSENAPPEQTQSADPAQQSFLPSAAAPPSAFSMSNLGRKLSKKAQPVERRRSEEVQRSSSAGLMARMDRFIGRTPSPAGRTRELESEDEAPPPPPIPTFPKPSHARKHSGSDSSLALAPPQLSVSPLPSTRPSPSPSARPSPAPSLTDRPSTTNIRTAAERTEMVKKARKIQQLLGDVPRSAEAGAFYRLSRAAQSEDSVLVPGSAGRDVIVISGSSDDARVGRSSDDASASARIGRGHRSTASLSSRPLLQLSPALTLPAFADLRTSVGSDEFGIALITPPPPESPKPDADEPRADEEDGMDDKAEDETALARRAKRAKVAKLYRYLGSRVPAHLVLGLDDEWDYEQGLPEVRSEDEGSGTGGSGFVGGKKKRRASDGDYALLEEAMGDLSVMSSEEKARAVRRKAKMEKMFGERPPQRLYQPLGDSTPRNEAEEAALDLDDNEAGAHYRSYRASFNSLAYFVNNADRDSLEGLYDIISGPADEEEDNEEQARSQFAARRKRAAKLSNFFGVSYRDLFGAVLDILESDVREDKEEGSLSAAETQDLLLKLKKLKAKGEGIHT